MVTTIALEEDAPSQLVWLGGDDDCLGGRITLVIQPIARERALALDYKQWRKDSFAVLTIGGWVWEG